MKIQDCRDCPFKRREQDMGVTLYWCSAPKAPEGYDSMLNMDNHGFYGMPKWCPLKIEPITIELENKMKTIALLIGGDWNDAGVEILDIPEGLDLSSIKKQWREWYETTYLPGFRDKTLSMADYKDFVTFLKEAGAKKSNIEYIYEEDIT